MRSDEPLQLFEPPQNTYLHTLKPCNDGLGSRLATTSNHSRGLFADISLEDQDDFYAAKLLVRERVSEWS